MRSAKSMRMRMRYVSANRAIMLEYSANLAHGKIIASFDTRFNFREYMETLSSVAQSRRNQYCGKFRHTCFQYRGTYGRKSNHLTCEDIAKYLILQLNNSDNLCFPRSLVMVRVHCEHGNLRIGELHEKWNCIRRQSSLLARELTRNAGVNSQGGMRNSRNRAFSTLPNLAAENIAIMVYNFSFRTRRKSIIWRLHITCLSRAWAHYYYYNILGT